MPQVLHTKDIGSITVYGDALTGGYDGTKAQLFSFIAGIANGAMLINVGYKTVTLSTSAWNEGTYDLTASLPTNRYSILAVDMDCDNVSGLQIAAWYDADISFSDGNILTAHKNVPEIDIPVVVVYQAMTATIEVPVYSGSLTYDGTLQTPVFDGYDDEVMTIGGVHEATDAGDYTATFTPKKGYKWTDGTRTAVLVAWSIAKDTLTAPTLKSNLVYDGTEQDIIDSVYDATKISVSGNTQTNAGDYEVTLSIVDKTNYEWGDTHTADDKVIAWSISRAAGSILLSTDIVDLSDDEPSAIVATTATGEVTAASSDESIVTTSVNDGDITVVLAGQGVKGTISVEAISAQTENYSSATATIKVRANSVKIVSWADGTDEEIAALVAAADVGDIDLYEDAGWRVGDERTFHISASTVPVSPAISEQDVTMVLLNRGGKTLTNGKECNFVVGTKELVASMAAHSSYNFDYTWVNYSSRRWCNNSFPLALNDTIRPIFKTFNNETASSTVEDIFSLHSLTEIFGVLTEGTQLEYYKTTENIKKSAIYWTRTKNRFQQSGSYTGLYVYYVTATGSYSSNRCNNSYRVPVFGCI